MAMDKEVDRLSSVFAALADPTRRAILARLASGDADVSELMKPFDLRQPTISKHLHVLERAGLVMRTRDAQRRPRTLVAVPLKDVAGLLTVEGVAEAIGMLYEALRRAGNATPRIGVCGLNPHNGDDGNFGREEIDIIKPAIDAAAADGIAVTGPFGADTMFHKKADAFIVMLHDQGHITAKLLARHATAGLAIGSPILFS